MRKSNCDGSSALVQLFFGKDIFFAHWKAQCVKAMLRIMIKHGLVSIRDSREINQPEKENNINTKGSSWVELSWMQLNIWYSSENKKCDSETSMLVGLELNTSDSMWSKLKREKSYKEALILELQLFTAPQTFFQHLVHHTKHMKHNIHLENKMELWVVIM